MGLNPLDDTMWHQIAEPFDTVGTSDHRFFDRMWFASTDPNGGTTLQFTIGVYNNMNVIDGGFVVVRGNTQYNLRESRSLRSRFEPEVGALRIEVVEPLQHIRLHVAENDLPVSGVLDWKGVLPPEQEKPHVARVRGRLDQNYQRFNQVGSVDGELRVDGERVALSQWWGCRDHSWGVRPGVGGWDPVTGVGTPLSEAGSLFAFLFFSTSEFAGHVQIAERGTERHYLTGLLRPRDGGDRDLRVEAAELSLEFHNRTRRIRRADFAVRLDDERSLTLSADALGPSLAMPGLGYSGGWNDGKALGVWRGDEYREVDIWDVTHPVDVIREDGSVYRPVHRIQPVSMRSPNGSGTGSLTLIANGALPQYGLS